MSWAGFALGLLIGLWCWLLGYGLAWLIDWLWNPPSSDREARP